MPIFDPSQYELWGYSLPTDPAGRVRTLSTNTAGHIARLLQTLGLDTASFESTVTFPDGMTLHYMGEDTVDGWGYPAPSPHAGNLHSRDRTGRCQTYQSAQVLNGPTSHALVCTTLAATSSQSLTQVPWTP